MIILNFSVLARPAETLSTRQPDPQGRQIWNMLFDGYMGRICVVSNERYDREQFETWLKSEGFKASVYEFLDADDPAVKAEKIHKIGTSLGRPMWYVDTDPTTAAECVKLGLPSLVVACPYVLRPEWVDKRNVRSWDSLVSELERQALLEAELSWRDES